MSLYFWAMTMDHNNRSRLYKKALRLECFTVGYNILEALASIFFGCLAGSIALVGFGLDSIVESLSGVILIWRLSKGEGLTGEEGERVEKKAVRFVAITFFVLAAYILFESIKKLAAREAPDPSLPGIIVASVSLVVMPAISFKKRTYGRSLGSRALVADSKETLACAMLSLALLTGLLLNYLAGLWWADPLAGILIVAFLVKEGWELCGEEEDDQ